MNNKLIADQHQLGELLGKHTASSPFHLISWLGSLVMLCIIGSGLRLISLGFRYFMDASRLVQAAGFIIAIQVVAVVMIASGLWGVYRMLIVPLLTQFLCFEQGFMFKKGISGFQVLRYDEVTEFWQVVTRNMRHSRTSPEYFSYNYTLKSAKGKLIEIGNDTVANVQEVVGNFVRNQVNQHLLPPTIKAYQSGNEVEFSNVSLSQQGLRHNRNFTPWTEVKQIKMDCIGDIHISKHKNLPNKIRLQGKKIPNLDIFVSLLRQSCEITQVEKL